MEPAQPCTSAIKGCLHDNHMEQEAGPVQLDLKAGGHRDIRISKERGEDEAAQVVRSHDEYKGNSNTALTLPHLDVELVLGFPPAVQKHHHWDH